MKWLLIYIFFLAGYQNDSYYVSHIKGTVRLAKTKKLLKVGDEISLTDSLIFSTKNDIVALISPEKGRQVITSENNVKTYGKSQFILAIKDNYFPATKINTLATRAGMMNSLMDVESYVQSFASQKDTLMLVVDSVRIPLSKNFFTDRENRFFFLRYEHQGESINKRLVYIEPKTAGDTLFLLLNSDVYEIDEKKMQPDSATRMTLFYYDTQNESSQELGSFKLNVVKKEVLLPEIKTLVNALEVLYKNKDDKQALIESEVSFELEEFYGRMDKQRLNALIRYNN